MIGTTEIILIVLAILVLFGGKKIPELARGMGSAFKEFKDGVGGIEEATAKTKTTKKKKKVAKKK